ncbi:MAG TPA: PP2C family protein-serine/threonine phosphatase, partial [Thermoanaerobaculia bacterium]
REATFATLLYLEIEPSSGAIELVNAGHLRPLLRQASGRVVALDLPAGVAAGVQSAATYRSRPARLEPGEALLLYTDGVTEAVAANGERFGDERLLRVVEKAGGDPEASAEAVTAAVQAFAQGAPADTEDDLTLLCLCRDGFKTKT